MAASQQPADPIDCTVPVEPAEVVEKSVDGTGNSKDQDQPLPSKDVETTTAGAVHGTSSLKSPKDAQDKAGFLGKGQEQTCGYPSNVYAPQSQTLFYGGYMNPSSQWEEYTHYFNADGMDAGSPGMYNENQSLMLHTGYGNSPQMIYGPYSPVTTIGDGQPYFPQHFPFSGPYYQQPTSPGMGYVSPANGGISQVDPVLQHDNFYFSPSSGYHQTFGSFDGASAQPSGMPGYFGQSTMPLASGMHQGSVYDSGPVKARQHASKFGGTTPSWSTASRRMYSIDKGLKQGKGSASFSSHNGSLEFLNEQNRGPRATRPKKQDTENSSADNENKKTTSVVDPELYNHSDFITEYKDAKFFVIKSYTEDHVHKSIKYGVWASTISGNKKLDSAYQEAREKEDCCPVFLFFSVNSSAQFCGVAEMIGPVDFEKSVDYWQQDKWSGQFPVKWHIIKDVPNNLLRHIILENNDNKPVTNSRDTQEVKLEQGIQMLSIFKNHEVETTILEDFDFYELREKAMQENRAWQVQRSTPADSGSQKLTEMNLMTKISESFANAVQLERSKNVDEAKDASVPADDTSAAANTEEDPQKPNAPTMEESN